MYYGCKKEKDDRRDYKMTVSVSKPTKFPDVFEIRTNYVKDQSVINSCVAHTLSEFMEETYKIDELKFSVGFIYGYRPLGYSMEEGMYPREAVKTLLKVGDCLNEDFDYNKEMPEIKKLVDKDLELLKNKASKYKVKSYARIYTENEIKQCLYDEVTVPISIPVYNNLAYDPDTLIIQAPAGECNGYHMMLLVGWTEKGYIVQNSWGKNWGHNGRAILPYGYPIDTAWAIDTSENDIETYTTIWQKIYVYILKIINYFKK